MIYAKNQEETSIERCNFKTHYNNFSIDYSDWLLNQTKAWTVNFVISSKIPLLKKSFCKLFCLKITNI